MHVFVTMYCYNVMLITLSYSIIHQSWHYYKNDTMPDNSRKTRIYSNISGLYFNFKHISCFTKIHSKVPRDIPLRISKLEIHTFFASGHIPLAHLTTGKTFSPPTNFAFAGYAAGLLKYRTKGSLREIPSFKDSPHVPASSPLLR